MPTYSHTRPTRPGGRIAALIDKDSNGDNLPELVKAQFSGKQFVTRAAGANISFEFDQALTAQEQTDLGTTVTAFVPTSNVLQFGEFQVTERSNAGHLLAIKIYKTDNGDGTYSDLAEERLFAYQGAFLTTEETKKYFTDGAFAGSEKNEYYTTSGGQTVRKKI